MNKNDWIKLINAIRLLKKDYRGKDEDIQYIFNHQKKEKTGYSIEGQKQIRYTYSEHSLGLYRTIGNRSYRFEVTFAYDYQIYNEGMKLQELSFYDIRKSHSKEVFVPHIWTGICNSMLGVYDFELDYVCGFYAAAFFYAFDIKEPRLQLIDKQWIVIDSTIGHIDFATYFSNYQVIPVRLPIPKFIDSKQISVLKLADGVEIKDNVDDTDTEDVEEYLNEIRKTIGGDSNSES